jgi:hypothetical protein
MVAIKYYPNSDKKIEVEILEEDDNFYYLSDMTRSRKRNFTGVNDFSILFFKKKENKTTKEKIVAKKESFYIYSIKESLKSGHNELFFYNIKYKNIEFFNYIDSLDKKSLSNGYRAYIKEREKVLKEFSKKIEDIKAKREALIFYNKNILGVVNITYAYFVEIHKIKVLTFPTFLKTKQILEIMKKV